MTTAWPRVVKQCEEMGIGFDPWQHGVGSIALGKRRDGKYAATVGGVVLSIPRQVGKTFLVGMIVIALCIIFPGLTVVWTAHRTRTATKTFQSLQGIVKRKKVRPFLAAGRSEGIRTSNGEQEIRFRNDSVIMFGAREQGFGRGFDEVDIEVFDEGQILTEKALEDMVPAANQSRQDAGALLFFIGTPPRPADPGEEFENRRSRALSGKADNMVYVEFSADPDADPDDQEQWAKANPSFPLRTPVESMERMRENLTDDASFKREGLGIWDAAGSNRVIPLQSWNDAGDEESFPVDRFALGIEVGPDQEWASVSLGGLRDDEDWHIELDDRRDGSSWLATYVETMVAANPQIRAVVGDVGGPLGPLLVQKNGSYFLKGTKVRITPLSVSDLGSACSLLLSGIMTGTVRHTRQPQVAASASVAGKRRLGDTGKWVWSRSNATSDITPIQSATYALWGAQSTTVKKPARTQESSKRKVVIYS